MLSVVSQEIFKNIGQTYLDNDDMENYEIWLVTKRFNDIHSNNNAKNVNIDINDITLSVKNQLQEHMYKMFQKIADKK